jgi:DNA primase small subunit
VGKTVSIEGPPLEWARRQFAQYYDRASIPPPHRLARREFAAFPFATETMMRRHATLRTPQEFLSFLRRETPRHVYYSSAYYQRPAAGTMAEKGWQGADLIFDLDSDHLRGAEQLDYAGQLALVKTRLVALVDDFLFDDFGIDPTSTSLVFSGGRGYHVHVRDDRFLSLSSPERRELVDYVLGTGFDPADVVERRRTDVRSGQTMGSLEVGGELGAFGRLPPRTRSLPSVDAPGWQGRTSRAVHDVLNRWLKEGLDFAVQEMVTWRIPRPKARRYASDLIAKERAKKILETRSLDVSKHDLPDEVLNAIVRGAGIEVQGETDAPVTTDIHRLIRLPNSLHGGTGFRVVPLARDEIAGFDPFRDALVAEGDESRTPITYVTEARYPFPGEPLHAVPAGTDELPTPVALFLVLRGEAELRPSPG